MVYVWSCLQAAEKKVVKVQADDPISFSQLINRADMGPGEVRLQPFQIFLHPLFFLHSYCLLTRFPLLEQGLNRLQRSVSFPF